MDNPSSIRDDDSDFYGPEIEDRKKDVGCRGWIEMESLKRGWRLSLKKKGKERVNNLIQKRGLK